MALFIMLSFPTTITDPSLTALDLDILRDCVQSKIDELQKRDWEAVKEDIGHLHYLLSKLIVMDMDIDHEQKERDLVFKEECKKTKADMLEREAKAIKATL